VPRRRVHAGIVLVGFVVASGLAMACLIFAALSMSGHDAHTTNVSAATTSTAPAPVTLPSVSRVPKTLSAPSTSAARTTVAAPMPTLSSAAAPSTTTTTTTTAPAVAPVAAGDCVDGASLARTTCGGTDSAYRVNSTAASGGQCPSDSDRSAPQTLPGGGTNTLCMDTDWEVGRCMSMSGGAATPASCDASVPGLVRVQDIKHGTADVNTCTDANRGVVYKQRHFVVCVAQQ